MPEFAHAPGLTRHPASAAAVRIAQASLNCTIEFVLLHDQRATVVAGIGPLSIQPRPLHPAERQLVEGHDVGRARGATAVRVNLRGGAGGALIAHAVLDETELRTLTAVAAMLSESVSVAPEPELVRAGSPSGDAVLASMRDAVFVVNSDFSIQWCNAAVITLFGWQPKEMIGKPAAEFIHPDDLASVLDAFVRLQAGHQIYRVRLRLIDPLGSWVPMSVTGLDHSENPNIGGTVLSLRSDERESEVDRELDLNRRVSSTILDNLHDAVIATDGLGAITIVNAAARRLFDIPADAPVATLTVDQILLFDAEQQPVALDAHPLSPGQQAADRELSLRSGQVLRQLRVTSSPVAGPAGVEMGTVATFHDVTQERSAARELRDSALHDQLTGLANRRQLTERLTALQSEGTIGDVAACFIDLDRFKNVNDIHGHRVGDKLLQAASSRLRSLVRREDILARHGGDEFVVVVVEETGAPRAMRVAERIRQVLGEPYEIDGNRLHLTASVGIVRQPASDLDPERLLQNADIALYAAKGRGRDRVEMFDQDLASATETEERQRNIVRDALDNNRLEIALQPIVDPAGRVVGAEALSRCSTDDGLLAPNSFLAAIDGTTLIVRLDQRAFELSCAASTRLAKSHPQRQLYIASNVSATSLVQPDFVETMLDSIERFGASPDRLCIELTETTAFAPTPDAIDSLHRLRGAGLRISLDDFGTGYSSLAHLRELPLQEVKIDRTFTAALEAGGSELAIASAITGLARALGLRVVAEGVETPGQRLIVADLGIDAMQGRLFSMPVPFDELAGILAADATLG